MSTYGEYLTEDEQKTFIRLERWLASICGKVGLSTEEQLAGTVLIMDHRRALGLPLLGSNPGNAAEPRDFDKEEALLGPAAHAPTGANVVPMRRKP